MDYVDTFSFVAKMVTIRTVLVIASNLNWLLYQMDVVTSFLQGDIFEEVYMEIAQGLIKVFFSLNSKITLG